VSKFDALARIHARDWIQTHGGIEFAGSFEQITGAHDAVPLENRSRFVTSHTSRCAKSSRPRVLQV
jgi:hypothetical protein